MRKSLYIVCLIVLVLACGCRPKGILSSRQMREVLIDLHKTDGLIYVCGLQHGYNEKKNMYYAMVLEEHGITQAQFDSSIVWYTAHPQLFDKIYPKVLAALEEERDDYFELHAKDLGVQLPEAVSYYSEEEARQWADSALWVTLHGYPSLWNTYPPTKIPTPPLAY